MDLQINDLVSAIRELSKTFQQANRDEAEKLREYIENETLLVFTLVTGGIVKGKITWENSQSLGILTESNQNMILYKHAIAFIQDK